MSRVAEDAGCAHCYNTPFWARMAFPLQSLCARIAERWRWFWGLDSPRRSGMAALGRAGEEAAESYLRERGLGIVARNWRSGRDELDLVARDGDVLVFCEVRARSERALVPGYFSVTSRKKRAVARAARAYLRGLASPPANFRFDIIEVSVCDGTPRDIRHHANVPLFPKHFHAAARPTTRHG